MIKKLSCLFVFGIMFLFSFFALVQQEEPKVENEIKVKAPEDDDDDDGIFETEDGVMYLSFVKFN